LQDYCYGIGKPEGNGIETNAVEAPKQVNENPAKNKAVGKATGPFETKFLIYLNGNYKTGT
jgi:hypothetical protein